MSETIQEIAKRHQSVLLKESLELMAWDRPGLKIADLTLGLGGHLEAFLKNFPKPSEVWAFDQDPEALSLAKQRLKDFPDIHFVHANFESLREHCSIRFDRIFVDLGVSSLQLDEPERGFSFRKEGPLDMRMDPSRGRPAWQLLAEVREPELVQILREYGEERRAPVYARRWVRERKKGAIRRTEDFVEALGHRLDSKMPNGMHPLTKVFQAIRIWTNREMDVLDSLLEQVPSWLNKNGRLGIISFHSLEDRRVKWSLKGRLKPLHKKVIQASDEERAQNPRSRSAKLRVYELPSEPE